MSVRPLPTLADTDALAHQIARAAAAGDVLLLDGPLGAGKTTFVRALVGHLGGDPTCVASPTFTLLHQYQGGQIGIIHLDAYRLQDPADLEGLGFSDLAEDRLAVIEWGERVAAAFVDHAGCWRLTFAHGEEPVARLVTVTAPARCAGIWDQTASAAAPQAITVALAAAPAQDPSAQPPANGSVVAIPVDAQGNDPLVRAYVSTHRQNCAFRTLSWSWFAAALAAVAGCGLLAAELHGQGDALSRFGDWPAFLTGAATAAALVALAGAIRRQRDPLALPVVQEAGMAATLVALAYLVLYDPLIGLGLVTALLCTVYLAAISFRLLALMLGGRRGAHATDLQAPPGGWPLYTVLVPLYREVNVARNILASLARLDYPRERLDVKFLLETDDPATLAALQAAGIPEWAEVVIVPFAQPKTKPRACNHGLQRARGDFLVIFDAEDRPEPDQLKQAVLAFQAAPPQVACLQAQLAYHNHRQNLLTRWFAMEYNVWFQRYLPGLARLGSPLPLGGTSNHFRTAVLRTLGGWDPFNVTEDCDLGVRLHLAGHRTALLDSTTWEEANSRVGNWLRQRSRWLKGYFVTHVVWSRRPLWLLHRLGPWSVWGFLLSVLFVPLLAATNLVLWAYAGLYATLVGIDLAHGFPLWTILAERDWAAERLSWPMWYAGPLEDPFFGTLSQIFFIASAVLLAGNLAFMVIAGLAGRRPGQRGVWPVALLLPLYWILISLAAWKGLWQALVKPHYWEKTLHGLDHGSEGAKERGSEGTATP